MRDKEIKTHKSAWNLILIPFAVLGFVGTGWTLFQSVSLIRDIGIPDVAFLSSTTRVGLILLSVGLMVASVGPGLLFANICSGLMPVLRKKFARDVSPNRSLIKFSLLLFAIAYPIALIGGLNSFSLSSRGVYYRSFFSPKTAFYEWKQVVEIQTQCFSKRGGADGVFKLGFDNGTKIDLFSAPPKRFFAAYSTLAVALKGVAFEFHVSQAPWALRQNSCPPSWEKYFYHRPEVGAVN